MKFLLLVLPALLLSSCVTKRKCDTKFPPQVIVKDSIVVSQVERIILRDTTIFIQGEKIFIKDNAYCDSLGRAQLNKKEVRAGRLRATVEIKNGEVKVDCNEDSLIKVNATLQDKIIEKNKEITHSKEEIRTVTEYKAHWYDKYIFRPVGIIGLVCLTFFIGKKKLLS